MVEPHVSLDSTAELSSKEDKVSWLVSYVEGLDAGTHFLITHCAEASPELEAMTGPDDPQRDWADRNRTSDLAAVTSPEAEEAVRGRGVRLTTLAEVWAGQG